MSHAELGLDEQVLAQMSPADVAALVDAVQRARADQTAALERAIDAALEHVPRLLRGALKKVLFT